MDEKSDNSNNCDNRNLSESFDEAFSTLDLVNAPDMDVFIKAIMLMDEKEAECLRGELNHVLCKYIDGDEKLKQQLIKNDYADFNPEYIVRECLKVQEKKLELLCNRVLQNIKSILVKNEDFIHMIENIYNYSDFIQTSEGTLQTDEGWLKNSDKAQYSELDEDLIDEFKQIHLCLCEAIELINPEYVNEAHIMYTSPECDLIRVEDVNKGASITFYLNCQLKHMYELVFTVNLYFSEFDKSMVKQMKEYLRIKN